jgi:hypothetical protein
MGRELVLGTAFSDGFILASCNLRAIPSIDRMLIDGKTKVL